jgi:hypothetical protein
MKAEILKNMMVDGRLLKSGDIIDVKGWKHAKALNRSRYIRIIEDEVKPAKIEAPKAPKPVALPIEESLALPVDEEVKPKETKKKAKEAE